jgi:hypothetical protein
MDVAGIPAGKRRRDFREKFLESLADGGDTAVGGARGAI